MGGLREHRNVRRVAGPRVIVALEGNVSSLLVLADFAEQLSLLSIAQTLRRAAEPTNSAIPGLPQVRTYVTTEVSGVSWLDVIRLCGAGHPDFPVDCLSDPQTQRTDVLFLRLSLPDRLGRTPGIYWNYGLHQPYGFGPPIEYEVIEDEFQATWDVVGMHGLDFASLLFEESTGFLSSRLRISRIETQRDCWVVSLRQPCSPSGELVSDVVTQTFLEGLKTLGHPGQRS